MEHNVSNEHLKLLQQVSKQGVLILDNSHKSECEYLRSNGYISFFQIPTAKTDDSGTVLSFDFDTSVLTVQITEKGKAYVDSHTSKKKTVKIELVISVLALISSISFGVLSLFF